MISTLTVSCFFFYNFRLNFSPCFLFSGAQGCSVWEKLIYRAQRHKMGKRKVERASTLRSCNPTDQQQRVTLPFRFVSTLTLKSILAACLQKHFFGVYLSLGPPHLETWGKDESVDSWLWTCQRREMRSRKKWERWNILGALWFVIILPASLYWFWKRHGWGRGLTRNLSQVPGAVSRMGQWVGDDSEFHMKSKDKRGQRKRKEKSWEGSGDWKKQRERESRVRKEKVKLRYWEGRSLREARREKPFKCPSDTTCSRNKLSPLSSAQTVDSGAKEVIVLCYASVFGGAYCNWSNVHGVES